MNLSSIVKICTIVILFFIIISSSHLCYAQVNINLPNKVESLKGLKSPIQSLEPTSTDKLNSQKEKVEKADRWGLKQALSRITSNKKSKAKDTGLPKHQPNLNEEEASIAEYYKENYFDSLSASKRGRVVSLNSKLVSDTVTSSVPLEQSKKVLAESNLDEDVSKVIPGKEKINEAGQYTKDVKALSEGTNIDQQIDNKVKQSGQFDDFNQPKQVDAVQDAEKQLNSQKELVESINNKEKQQQALKEKAAYMASEELKKMLPQLKEAQQTFSKYKKKMAWFKEGSGDKPNSLKEEPISKRFIWGLNLQPTGFNPVNIAFAPYLGYRLNKKISAGVSFANNTEIKPENVSSIQISEKSSGYRLFTNYKIIKGFFTHLEFEGLNVKEKDQVTDRTLRNWKYNGYVGVGKNVAVSKKMNITMHLLANVLHPHLLSFHKEAFQFRIGISRGT
jgi:hypothetical protein